MRTAAGADGANATELPGRVLVLVRDELARVGLRGMAAAIPGVRSVTTCDRAAEAAGVLARHDVDALVCGPGEWVRLLPLLPAGPPRRLGVLHLLDEDGPHAVDVACLQPGHGFLMRSATTSAALRDALSRLGPDQVSMPPGLARSLAAGPGSGSAPARPERTRALNARETRVLALLAQGLSNRQIAARLGISEHGVKRHVTNVLGKLHVGNRTTAVAVALREGLLTGPEAEVRVS
ncbi:response regulator transcription factor [Kitasatospora phosalacinea]|uniref:response regulator transcription factor n=1 Tax=Kitasatospora phosalacinea TaxID=2065 RepID=UPI003668E10D